MIANRACGETFDSYTPITKAHGMAYVYILECNDGSYYVGSTRNLERRTWEHREGIGAA